MPLSAELIAWCTQYPPYLTAGDLEYFFRELVQEESDVYIYDENGQRAVVFVFLRRVQSRQGWVPLDLAAHVPETKFVEPLRKSLDRASLSLPAGAQGLLVSLPESYRRMGPVLEAAGCVFSHESAHMVAPTHRFRTASPGVIELGPGDFPEIYELTLRAFVDAADMVIPSYELWVKRRDPATARSFGIRGEDGTLLAFCNLLLHETFVDLRTLGVEAAARKQGFGERLLRHTLFFAREAGRPNVELTVSVKNRQALSLYERVGFATFSSTLAWCLPRRLV